MKPLFKSNDHKLLIFKNLGLLLLILVPVAYLSWTQNPTRIKDLIVGLTSTFIFIFTIFRPKDIQIFKLYNPFVEGSLLIFLVLNFSSLYFNLTEFGGGTYLFELISLIIIFYFFTFLSQKDLLNDSFVKANLIAAFFVMGIGVIQIFWGSKKPISTFGNPNYFGGYLVTVLPLFWMIIKHKSPFKILSLINIALFIIMALWIRSWAMILSVVLGVFIFIFIYIQNRKGRLLSLFVYTILIVGIFQMQWVQESLIQQVALDIRPHIWKGVVNLIMHHPWIGCGAGQFFIFYPLYRDPEYFTHPLSVDSTDHAHCEILELISEVGLMGLLSFLAFLFFLIYGVIKNVSHRDRKFQIYVYSILTGVFLLMFENSFDVNMRYMSSKFIFWSFLGWCYGLSNQTNRKQSNAKSSFTIFQKSLGMIFIFFVLSYGFLIPFLSDYYFGRGVRERAQEHYESAVRFYHKSIKLWPKQIEAQYRLGYLYGSLGFKERAVSAYHEVIKIAPFFSSVHGNIGTIYSQLDQLESAHQHLSLQIKLNPYDSDRLCILASVLIRMGKIEEGKVFLRRALLHRPQHEFALTVLQKLRDDEARFKADREGDSVDTNSRS